MRLKDLRRVHPDYCAELLERYGDLFAGGHRFARNVTKYLPRHDVEPSAVYKRRCAQAHYLGYVAPICNLFASWLFSCPLQITSDPPETDAFYRELKEDCDGLGTDLDQFLRGRFVEALQHQRAWFRVAFPATGGVAPDSRREWEQLGAGRAYLVAVPTRHVTHWRRDASGALAWVVEHECRTELAEFTDTASVTVETWTLWRADGSATRWELRTETGKPAPPDTTVVDEVEAPHNPCGTIPLVELAIPTELWVLNLLASGQLEHFRKMCALSWSIDRTCYAMPVLTLKGNRKAPVMGAGYYLQLGPGEELKWPAPPSSPFEAVQDFTTKLREEMYRITSQMAASVDNNAAAVGRSGESKDADNKATEVVLGAFGRPVREAVERMLDLVSMGRGEEIAWHVGGMDAYEHADPAAEVERATAIAALQIPSPTLRREILVRAALAQLPDADETKKQKIREEIEASTPLAGTTAATQGPARDGATPPATQGAPAATTAPRAADAPSGSDVSVPDAPATATSDPNAAKAQGAAAAQGELPEVFGYDMDAGILMVDEARARKGLPALPDGKGRVSIIVWRALQEAEAERLTGGSKSPAITRTAPDDAATT